MIRRSALRPAVPHIATPRAASTALAPLVVAVLAGPAAAQNVGDVLPPGLRESPGSPPAARADQPPRTPATASDRVLLPQLRGLAFVPAIEAVRRAGIDRPGFSVDGALPALDQTFRTEVEPLIGGPLTTARLDAITQAVVRAYRRADRPLVDAIVPEQDVNSGTVQVAVLEFRVGEVRVEGNRWFTTDLLRSRLRLTPGEPVRARQVAEDLSILNESPFRQAEVLYQRSDQLGRTDVILRAPDRLPLRIYAGYEDTGTRTLGINRAFVGAAYGNLFGLDQTVNYQYTASTDLLTGVGNDPSGLRARPRFEAHSVTYTVPLPWRDRLVLSGLYAESRPWLSAPFTQSGYTTQASLRYAIRLPRTETFGQELRLGYDYKRTNNNLAFGGFLVSNVFTEIHQATIDYSATLLDALGASSATLLGVASPGGLSPGNERAAFEASRAGASPRYAYALLQVERSVRLPADFSLALRATGQLASGPLLASEQLGLGGVTSVRGYDNFALTGDAGYILSAEVRAPAVSLLQRLDWGDRDRFQPLAFVETGHVWSRTPQGNAPRDAALSSIGAGLRYAVDRFLDLRFDYGVGLERLPTTGQRQHRGHVSLVASW